MRRSLNTPFQVLPLQWPMINRYCSEEIMGIWLTSTKSGKLQSTTTQSMTLTILPKSWQQVSTSWTYSAATVFNLLIWSVNTFKIMIPTKRATPQLLICFYIRLDCPLIILDNYLLQKISFLMKSDSWSLFILLERLNFIQILVIICWGKSYNRSLKRLLINTFCKIESLLESTVHLSIQGLLNSETLLQLNLIQVIFYQILDIRKRVIRA